MSLFIKRRINPMQMMFIPPPSGGTAVLSYLGNQQVQISSTFTPPLFSSVPIGTNLYSGNRRVLVHIVGASSAAGGANVTAVSINGSSVGTNFISVAGSGGDVGTVSNMMVWAWADIPTGTANVAVTITDSASINNTGFWTCNSWAFDNTLLANSSPTHAEAVVTNAAALTTLTNTIATSSGCFLIGAIVQSSTKSPAGGTITLTSSSDTLTNDYAFNTIQRARIDALHSGGVTNGSDSIQWSWTNASQAFSSMLTWT